MSDSDPFPSEPMDLHDRLRKLVVLVENTDDHLFSFVRYNTVAEREAGIAFLKERLSIPIQEVGLGTTQKERSNGTASR